MLNIEFDKLKINTISETSGVFSGDNLLVNWKAESQSCQGFGSLSGNNNLYINNKSGVTRETPPKTYIQSFNKMNDRRGAE